MAVTPFLQRRGIGTALINASLQSLREKQCEWVVVLGHPSYYPRYGFRPAHEHGIVCEYKVSPKAFMVLELLPNALEKVTGIVSYHSAFASLYPRPQKFPPGRKAGPTFARDP